MEQFQGRGFGVAGPSEFLSMRLYLANLVMLAIISRDRQTILLNEPRSLGTSFRADQ